VTRPLVETLAPDQLVERARRLADEAGRMQMAYAWQPPDSDLPEVRYLVNAGAEQAFCLWACRPVDGRLPSLTPVTPLLAWYEREISDLYGITFSDHPQPDPLVLMPGARLSTPPRAGVEPTLHYAPEPVRLPQLDEARNSNEVQILPFGPIRAGVVESAKFTYLYVGESILHYHPQLFFKHRGMEQRFTGVKPELGTVLAERVSGVGSVAHALAYCQALEAAADCSVPPRAAALRVLLAEMERLYNHLYYLGHLADTTTLKVGHAEGTLLAERAKQLNARVTGSRFLRGLIAPGGLRRAPDLDGLSDALDALRRQVEPYLRRLQASTTYLDRLITTGRLDRQTAFDQGATGPVERASGLDRDLRRDHPYAAYADLPLAVAKHEDGDAHARQQVRITELLASFALCQRVLLTLPASALREACATPAGGEGLGWAESPRGSLFYMVHLDGDGRLARVKIKSPSFSNWRAFPFTVHDSNMMDYAINEASFGLTIAGCDR